MEDWQAKLLQLGIGIVAWLVVVAVIVFVADRAPKRGRERFQLLIFIGPAGGLLLVGLVYPTVRTTILSFFGPSGKDFVGLENYGWMFSQREILTVLRNTGIWVLLTPFFATTFGLVYALLIDKSKTESLQKIFVFMPMAISFVGAGIIWKFVYAARPPGLPQIGLLNQVVIWFGGTPPSGGWLLNAPWNTLFLIVVMIWIQAGFAMVVLSAAIKGIPPDITEAARLDGVDPWQMFWSVTLPTIRPAVVVVYVSTSIGVLKVFDIVRTMTGGQFETSVVANELYTQAFRAGQLGRGCALAVILFVLVTPIVFYQVRNLRRQRDGR
jgi:alpha-glucoside transport system permease protein